MNLQGIDAVVEVTEAVSLAEAHVRSDQGIELGCMVKEQTRLQDQRTRG